MLCWNEAFWLAIPSHVTSFNQSECIISAQHSYTTLKLVYDIGCISTPTTPQMQVDDYKPSFFDRHFVQVIFCAENAVD